MARNRSRNLAIAASLLAHAGFLALLVSVVRRPVDAGPSPTTDVRIVPDWARPTADQENRREARTRRIQRVDQPRSATLALTAAVGHRALSSPPPAAVSAKVADVATPIAGAKPGATSGGASLSGLRAAVGCRNADFLQLSSVERDRCRDRFATATPGLRPEAELGIDPVKKAAFDASWKADHSEQHMAGVACLATFGWHGLKWAHPSEGVKLGALPCYAYTPKATFSVDAPHARGW